MRTLDETNFSLATARKDRLMALKGWVDIDAINYGTKYTTKMKAILFYCDQIKFIEPVLKPRTPE